MCFATIYCYFAIPCILYGHSCLTWMGYCWKMKKESYFLKTWNHFSFITRSHGQMMLLCSGSLIYWLQHVSALQELFHSWSFSAGSICCTTELCNERSAAGAPCCDLNAPCGWEGSESWEKRAEQPRTWAVECLVTYLVVGELLVYWITNIIFAVANLQLVCHQNKTTLRDETIAGVAILKLWAFKRNNRWKLCHLLVIQAWLVTLLHLCPLYVSPARLCYTATRGEPSADKHKHSKKPLQLVK